MINQKFFTKEEFEVNGLSIQTKTLIQKYLSENFKGKRCVFGRNENALELSNMIQVDFFIDDFAEIGTFYNNKPIIKRSEIPENAIIINCILCNEPVNAINLLGVHKNNTVSFVQLCDYLKGELKYPKFVSQTRLDLYNNFDKWEQIHKALKDEESQKVLKDILKYRLTGDHKYMDNYKVNLKEQYFANAEFLELNPDSIFVDCGGFDGDTSEEFIKRCPNFKKIYFFEPCEENFNNAKNRLKSSKIEFIQKGVSDKNDTLKFNKKGSASGISDKGDTEIIVTTIDDSVKEKINFIKMDLEGWELPALEGARKHIISDSPNLAIAVYHSAQDFWAIFEHVMSLNPNYEVYLRHYTQGWAETVMFFIKKGL